MDARKYNWRVHFFSLLWACSGIPPGALPPIGPPPTDSTTPGRPPAGSLPGKPFPCGIHLPCDAPDENIILGGYVMLALEHGPLLQWRSSTKQFFEQFSRSTCLLGRVRHLERHVAQVATPSPCVCAHERLAGARPGPALRSRVRVGASVQEASPPPGSPPRPPARRTTGRIGGTRDEAYFKNLGVAFRWGTQFNVDDLNSILVRVRADEGLEEGGSCVWLCALMW